MAVNSRAKGKREELALAKVFREHGYEARRGQQYCGANGDADVVGLPYTHVECKHVQHLNIFDAMAQSVRDAKDGEIPIVCHKKNYTDWLVTMKIEDWFKLYREWECSHDSK